MISAIIPAAGLSRRMGVPKHLLPFGGTTVIGHIVDQLVQGGVDEVRVVVGHHADQIAQALSHRPVSMILNPDYQQTDMLASIRCGLKALPEACEMVLVALGDQPAVTAALVRDMIASCSTAAGGIVVPVYGERLGHPLLFSKRYCGEILASYDDVGLRGLLAAHPQDIMELRVPTPAVLSDMDCPSDYRRELARLTTKTTGSDTR